MSAGAQAAKPCARLPQESTERLAPRARRRVDARRDRSRRVALRALADARWRDRLRCLVALSIWAWPCSAYSAPSRFRPARRCCETRRWIGRSAVRGIRASASSSAVASCRRPRYAARAAGILKMPRSVSVSARLAGLWRMHRHDDRRRRRVKQRAKLSAAGKERGGMAVRRPCRGSPTSKRQRQGGSAPLRACDGRRSSSLRAGRAARTAPPCAWFCSSVAAHQLRVRARRLSRHQALVDQRDDHLRPVDGRCRQRREEWPSASCRPRPRGCRVPRAAIAVGSAAATLVGERFAPARRASANSCQKRCRSCASVSALSCQVRPSRSISAIDGGRPPGAGRIALHFLAGSSSQACRIGSTQRQAASTSSRRMNSVWLPRITSRISRS